MTVKTIIYDPKGNTIAVFEDLLYTPPQAIYFGESPEENEYTIFEIYDVFKNDKCTRRIRLKE